MKIIMMIASLFFVSAARAANCPEVSGVYRTVNKVLLKLEQVNCDQLKKTFGIDKEDGTGIKWITSQTFRLDGTPLCRPAQHCESVTAMADALKVRLNFNGSVATVDHGDCSQNGYDLVKTDRGDLQANFLVSDCKDGYAGRSTRLFPVVR